MLVIHTGHEYIGCYNDKIDDEGRAMKYIGYRQTFSLCGSDCGDLYRYKYFAYSRSIHLSNTGMCFCGYDISVITRYGLYTGSNWNNITRSNFSSNGNYTINGQWTIAIYKLTPGLFIRFVNVFR